MEMKVGKIRSLGGRFLGCSRDEEKMAHSTGIVPFRLLFKYQNFAPSYEVMEMDEELMPEEKAKERGEQPAFRVVQAEKAQTGETKFRSVGGLWRKLSRNGNEFYTLKIGNLKLLVFPNKENAGGAVV